MTTAGSRKKKKTSASKVKGATRADCSCGQEFSSVAQWKLHFLNNTARGNRSAVNKGGTEEHSIIRRYQKKAVEATPEPTQCMCFISFTGRWDSSCCTIHEKASTAIIKRYTSKHEQGCFCSPCSEMQRRAK